MGPIFSRQHVQHDWMFDKLIDVAVSIHNERKLESVYSLQTQTQWPRHKYNHIEMKGGKKQKEYFGK